VITNDTASVVTLRDASGSYHFVISLGEQRNIVAPDYSHPQDALTFVTVNGGREAVPVAHLSGQILGVHRRLTGT
jgi:hypothetical protein